VLIGEPGVGKTAIVEALRNASSTARCLKAEAKQASLDRGALIAGAKFRRIRGTAEGVLNDLAKQEPGHPVHRQLHTMVGAQSRGSMDAGNMLKPALARGELHRVGATTLDESTASTSRRTALERRFQKVLVDEPSSRTPSRSFVAGRSATKFTTRSRSLTDKRRAATLSHRCISDQQPPDKAIDLIDEAGRGSAWRSTRPEEMDWLERRSSS
jgi:ATP-dependent Clp protease ATP-binding subunit ClpA